MANQVTTNLGRPTDPSGLNAFGMTVPSMGTILQNPRVERFVELALKNVADHIGIPPERTDVAINELRLLARTSSCLADYELAGHRVLTDAGVIAALPQKLTDRAWVIHSQVASWIVGDDICDLGCGDGKVGKLIASDGKNVTLADVYQHPHIVDTGLPFSLFSQSDSVPLAENSVDTTLLLTVLHHADNPVALLKEGIRITRPRGRVILIESVFGITPEQAAGVKAESFGALSFEEQRLANIFFDHLYNRLIHFSSNPANKVNVPFNFSTPEKWASLLAQCGAPQIQLELLGIDQPAVPEFHTLHVGLVAD